LFVIYLHEAALYHLIPVFNSKPNYIQGWAQGSFVEAEVKAERSRQRRGKAAMSLTEARQGRGRELEVEARQTKFEARPS